MNRIRQTLATAILFSCLAACNNESRDESRTEASTTTDTAATTSSVPTAAVGGVDTTISGCYTMIAKRDTANLQIEVKGANVTGPLSYKIYEKDRNDGTFQGEINGSLLTGWYLFKSEGMMSVRQVAWKISNGKLFAATGEMKERNDSSIFVNPDKLQFDTARPFVKVACVM